MHTPLQPPTLPENSLAPEKAYSKGWNWCIERGRLLQVFSSANEVAWHIHQFQFVGQIWSSSVLPAGLSSQLKNPKAKMEGASFLMNGGFVYCWLFWEVFVVWDFISFWVFQPVLILYHLEFSLLCRGVIERRVVLKVHLVDFVSKNCDVWRDRLCGQFSKSIETLPNHHFLFFL